MLSLLIVLTVSKLNVLPCVFLNSMLHKYRVKTFSRNSLQKKKQNPRGKSTTIPICHHSRHHSSIMMALRFFQSSHQVRTLSKESKKILTRGDVDFLCNPGERYMDAFMKAVSESMRIESENRQLQHGKDRAVFKRNDISMWQKSFGDAYKFKLMCLKGTDTMVSCEHACDFEPLDPSVNEPITFIGLGWLDPKFRKMKAAIVLGESTTSTMPPNPNISSNISKCPFEC